jgi:hypothetical protein
MKKRFSMEMLFWGRGTVIFLITFVCALLMESITRAAFATTDYYQVHGWPKLVAFWAAAGFVYRLRAWFRVGQEQTTIDKKPGQVRKISAEAKLLFIPARFWPAVLIVLGLVFLFYNPQGDA